MRKLHISKNRLLALLDVLKFTLMLLLFLIYIILNAKLAHQTEATKVIAENTQTVVQSQADILAAIKQVTTDTNVTAAQQTAIIICMLQVPIENRTTDLQAKCRAQAKAVASNNSAETAQDPTGISSPGSSTNTTPKATPPQSDNSQNSQTDQRSNIEKFLDKIPIVRRLIT